MARPTYDQLLQIIAEKDRQILRLQSRVTQFEARVVQLEQRLEQATRSAKRQAAPFSKGSPVAEPKKPGRKAGKAYGKKAHRPPPPQQPDEVIDVPLPWQCPDCDGEAQEDHVKHQFQVEIPRRPVVRRFDLHVGSCTRCGRRLQPRHPLQTSDATGAAASQLGPDLQALIALMKNKYGLSYGDIQGLLKQVFGVSITRGGAAHVVLRMGRRSRPVYDAIRDAVRHSHTVYPDETGWKVAARLQWMGVFVADKVTLYVIRPSRGGDVPRDVLGADYGGRMIHDGWSPYDSFEQATHQQCLAHLLRRAGLLLEQATRGAVRFPRKVKTLLLDSLRLRDRREAGRISEHGLACARGRLSKRLDRLLTWRLSHRGNRTFRNPLARHADAVLTFLYEPGIEATNWPAEQAIRPAVVNRKVFGGNRTPAGARAQEILGSILATCDQQAQDALAFLSTLIRAPADQRPDHLSRVVSTPQIQPPNR